MAYLKKIMNAILLFSKLYKIILKLRNDLSNTIGRCLGHKLYRMLSICFPFANIIHNHLIITNTEINCSTHLYMNSFTYYVYCDTQLYPSFSQSRLSLSTSFSLFLSDFSFRTLCNYIYTA